MSDLSSKHVPASDITQNSWYPWLIWTLGAAFFLSEYFARVAPSVMVPELMRAFSVNAMSLGALSAFFYYAYVGMQLPVGTLMDKFGPHRLLTLTATLCAIGCFIFAASNNLALAKFGRFLMGFGAAFAFVGTLKLATIWFPTSRFGFLAGATQALGMLGAALGAGPMSIMVTGIGWRNTMWFIGGILLLLALMIGFFVRDTDSSDAQQKSGITKVKLLPSLIVVLKNPQSWLISLYAGLLYAPTAAFAELWGTSYVVSVYSMTKHIAATGISLIFIGWAIGSPIAGWISDAIKARKPIMYFSGLASFILMSAILYLHNIPKGFLFVALFLYGMCNIGVATSYAVASEINPRAVSGTSMAFTNMASVLIGAGFQPLIGKLLVMKWDHTIVDHIPIYSPDAYRFAMLALPVCFILCIVTAYFVKETHCRVTH